MGEGDVRGGAMLELMFVLSGVLIIVLAKPLTRGFVRLHDWSMRQQELKPEFKWFESYQAGDLRKASLVMRLAGGGLIVGGIVLGAMKTWLKSL